MRLDVQSGATKEFHIPAFEKGPYVASLWNTRVCCMRRDFLYLMTFPVEHRRNCLIGSG